MPVDTAWKLPDSEWKDIGGETLTLDEAAKLIRKRLGLYEQVTGEMEGWSDKSAAKKNQTGGYDLSIALAAALPPEALNDQVLQNMDMRTLLQPILNTEVGAENRGDVVINGQTFTPMMQVKAGSAFVKYKAKVAEDFEQKLIDAGFSLEQIPDLVDQEMQRWRDNPGQFVRVHSPEGQVLTDPNTGQITTTGANKDLTDFASLAQQIMAGTGDGTAPPAFMTADDYATLFEDNSSMSAIEQYRKDQAAQAQWTRENPLTPAPADPTRIRFEEGQTAGPYMRPGATQADQERVRAASGTYTLSQARKLPNTMTREQVKTLSDKMKKAGLFAQVGAEPLIKGDAQDPAFVEAYRLLLSKTIQRGEPVNDILAADSLAYEEELDTKIRAKLTDPARIRASADTLGRQILGRKLTNADQAKLVKFINDLEHKQAVSEQTPDAEGDVTDVDWEARMSEYIKNANPGEAGAHEAAQQFDVFRSLLSGPGGGRQS